MSLGPVTAATDSHSVCLDPSPWRSHPACGSSGALGPALRALMPRNFWFCGSSAAQGLGLEGGLGGHRRCRPSRPRRGSSLAAAEKREPLLGWSSKFPYERGQWSFLDSVGGAGGQPGTVSSRLQRKRKRQQ
mmetsp:Transcript_33740/g.73835  ORF Transcript_33740/g.73835 Transcript_33740/m.73835 type:complete len:132 (-) Transcript_33740:614-1009(-)